MTNRLASQIGRQMKPTSVISLAGNDVSNRIDQALSYTRLEGLKTSKKVEDLIRDVASGLVSVEQAIRDLNKLHQVKTRPRSRSHNVSKVLNVR